ncbi:MAG: pyruvate dehydrogenase complex dihydrolipoamide acetyltransferase [Rhodospirillales bacterium]|nr:pyruvate dehydrogenase complex dihydrolipoamide acetyltransferase [Rhodospirillales bacterium]
MPIQILMPALSPTMTDGKLAKWHKKEGDAVESGDVLAEIETDKATMEVEAVDEGTLGKILVAEGTEGVLVNQPIALLLEEGEDASALKGAGVAAPAAKPAAAPPAPKPVAPAAVKAPAPAPAPKAAGGRVFASPLARRLAGQHNLDLTRISGSGPRGRVVKRDIEAAAAGSGARMTPAVAAQAVAPITVSAEGLPPYREIPNSSIRKVVARRLTEAKQQIPHFYLSVDCEIDRLLALRKELNDAAPEGEGNYKLSVNDFVIRAVALALGRVPAANAMWTDAAIRRFDRADISVAVAIEGGLITPVIRAAALKSIVAISDEMKGLATKARAGKLKPEEYQGGTFTISNLGMYGIKTFAAIINPPQGCILAVGAGEQRAVVKGGQLAVATLMSCTLAVDHRVVDGAVGAEFLAAFKKLIEAPATILL